MDLEKYMNKYNNVSRGELDKIRDSLSISTFNEMFFESKVKSLYEKREKEKRDGRRALRPGPLIHVLSVNVQPEKKTRRGWLSMIFISASVMILNFLMGANNVFIKECFSLDDNKIEYEYEQVKSMFIRGEQGTVTLHYIAIPFGVYCRVEVMFYNRQGSRKDKQEHRSFHLNGKIVARYGNTYGTYASEEYTLFEKQSDEFERVEIDHVKSMQLSRCWVALPAYSSIVVGVDLSEFETGRKIVNRTVELVAQPGWMFGDSFVLDDIIIQVRAAWFSPTPPGPFSSEESDLEQEDKSSDDGSNNELPSNLYFPWKTSLTQCQKMWWNE
ncbi:hypothetical protein OROGR_030174 [Orobanche gracilis]